MPSPAITPFTTSLIPSAANRPTDDPIFLLNAEATKRAQAGESIVNATLGALMEDDGTLAVMPSVVEALQRVPAKIVMDDPPTDVALGPGMSVEATVRVNSNQSLYERLRAWL